MSEITLFGETNYKNQRRRFGIKTDDRRRHMYLLGKTGVGKSTILENMIIDDIRNGHGVGVVDPHGDLAEKILEFIPNNRINDIVYVNPADFEYPVAFNILETIDPRYKHLVSSGLMGVFKKIWPDVWSARMEYILNNTLLALLDYPGSTMLGVNRMLSDKLYRLKVIEKIQDPVVKAFWVDEFSKYNDRYANEAIAPIQNKVGQFLSVGLIRNIVGQVKSTINIREIMDSKKILIMNLSKGRIGEDNSRLLGGMLITKIQLSAMERVDTPEEQRKDFYLYVDEFQNFATESFANILSEARKYRLDLIMAHQYIEQLDEMVRAAVFGNVGTMVVFRVGAADAEFLVKEFTPRFTEEDLVNLPKFNYYLKLMIDGVSSDPFSAVGLAPLQPDEKTGNLGKVIRVSRERYAVPREVVEDKIHRWTQPIEIKSGSQQAIGQKKERTTFTPSSPRHGVKGAGDKNPLRSANLKTMRPPHIQDVVIKEETDAPVQMPTPISLKTLTEKKPVSFTSRPKPAQPQPHKKKENT
ncbi:type IV secretion system DNA-binding domain-containing protein [Candidatus Uhrbacteria bacterium]|nr:type IV secretion system DNA-binding domain-containing protein [Candidatus Uhrbacteria bacterium]